MNLAQQINPPMEEALRTELGNKISESLMLRAALIEIQRTLATAQERVKALEDKYEPKE